MHTMPVQAHALGCSLYQPDAGHDHPREGSMTLRNFLLLVALATVAAAPSHPQSVAQTASIPDFTSRWVHPSIPGFEPLASGPTSLTNRSRRNGVGNILQLVGDYTNPILKQQAAETVKNFGELSLKGITFPSPA